MKETPPFAGDSVEKVKVDGFRRTPWLNDEVAYLQKMSTRETREFSLPPDIDFNFFVAELGKSPVRYEFGGLYNPLTRSMVIKKEKSASIHGFSVGFMAPRPNEAGNSDDTVFHTHPINYENGNTWDPSPTDNNLLLAIKMIEEDDGFDRAVRSTIGSDGCISVTTATGIRIDHDRLIAAGIPTDKLAIIESELALAPPRGLKNLAKDSESEAALLAAAEKFFNYRKLPNQIGAPKNYKQKVDELRVAIAPLVKPTMYSGKPISGLEYAINSLANALPQYPSSVRLNNMGFTDAQRDLLHQMIGLTTDTYRVIEDIGLKKMS